MDASIGIVQVIGDRVLKQCSSLAALDLTHLANVQQVGSCLLSGCSFLKHVTISQQQVAVGST